MKSGNISAILFLQSSSDSIFLANLVQEQVQEQLNERDSNLLVT